jgi:hypothetical protein
MPRTMRCKSDDSDSDDDLQIVDNYEPIKLSKKDLKNCDLMELFIKKYKIKGNDIFSDSNCKKYQDFLASQKSRMSAPKKNNKRKHIESDEEDEDESDEDLSCEDSCESDDDSDDDDEGSYECYGGKCTLKKKKKNTSVSKKKTKQPAKKKSRK